MIALYVILGIIAFVFAIVLVKTLLFVPKKENKIEVQAVEVDLDKAANDLADMIKCKTISHRDPTLENDEEFERFISLLGERFPLIYKNCTFERMGMDS